MPLVLLEIAILEASFQKVDHYSLNLFNGIPECRSGLILSTKSSNPELHSGKHSTGTYLAPASLWYPPAMSAGRCWHESSWFWQREIQNFRPPRRLKKNSSKNKLSQYIGNVHIFILRSVLVTQNCPIILCFTLTSFVRLVCKTSRCFFCHNAESDFLFSVFL